MNVPKAGAIKEVWIVLTSIINRKGEWLEGKLTDQLKLDMQKE